MTIHGLLLSIVVALSLTSLMIFLRGGRFRDWAALVLSTWISFLVGHFFAEWIGWHLWRLGSINFFSGILGATMGLLIAQALLRPLPCDR